MKPKPIAFDTEEELKKWQRDNWNLLVNDNIDWMPDGSGYRERVYSIDGVFYKTVKTIYAEGPEYYEKSFDERYKGKYLAIPVTKREIKIDIYEEIE